MSESVEGTKVVPPRPGQTKGPLVHVGVQVAPDELVIRKTDFDRWKAQYDADNGLALRTANQPVAEERTPDENQLDAAWAEAEAAVAKTGRSFLRLAHNTYDHGGKHYDYYYAACNWAPGELGEDSSGPTPTAALLALAAALRSTP
jgi:hypothetical protein